jgi:hypothetical protein
MPEPTTIRAEQIEGLPELIREQVRAVISEGGPPLQDVEEIRRSPAGILIRLEERVKGPRREDGSALPSPWKRGWISASLPWTSAFTL